MTEITLAEAVARSLAAVEAEVEEEEEEEESVCGTSTCQWCSHCYSCDEPTCYCDEDCREECCYEPTYSATCRNCGDGLSLGLNRIHRNVVTSRFNVWVDGDGDVDHGPAIDEEVVEETVWQCTYCGYEEEELYDLVEVEED